MAEKLVPCLYQCFLFQMKTIELVPVEHSYKIGDQPLENPPTFIGDAMFTQDGEPVGFYIERIPERLKKLTDIADYELNSKRVPKSVMKRSSSLIGNPVLQHSCIIGSVPPKPHMRRAYATRSSVHGVKTAQTFVKAMTLAGKEALSIIESVSPQLYDIHKTAVEKSVPKEWRFCDHFTSSISNFNIAAAIHRDNLNVKGALNVIITKRRNSKGGNLYLPDYDTTINCANDSMLVYPAWRNMHGVTPIVPTHSGGYRNSLVWYALDAFKDQKGLKPNE